MQNQHKEIIKVKRQEVIQEREVSASECAEVSVSAMERHQVRHERREQQIKLISNHKHSALMPQSMHSSIDHDI